MNDTVIVITRNGMGSGEADLQRKLLGTYLALLLENGTLPGAVCFYTDGVRTVIEGSPVLDQLHELERRGVHLIICQTCINYFGLADRVRVGLVGGMGDILAAQSAAAKVITL
jgi:intracellular sulfur oxidation DsrE/DsrF family protein